VANAVALLRQARRAE